MITPERENRTLVYGTPGSYFSKASQIFCLEREDSLIDRIVDICKLPDFPSMDSCISPEEFIEFEMEVARFVLAWHNQEGNELGYLETTNQWLPAPDKFVLYDKDDAVMLGKAVLNNPSSSEYDRLMSADIEQLLSTRQLWEDSDIPISFSITDVLEEFSKTS